MTLSYLAKDNLANIPKLLKILKIGFRSISDLLEVTANCKSVLMREYYNLRFITSVFTISRKSQK